MEENKKEATDKNLPAVKKGPGSIALVDGVLSPTTFDEMWQVSVLFAKSGMMPNDYANRPEAIMVAGQFGAQLGLTLLASLQNIAVVKGNPTVYGDSQKALVQDSGTLETFVEYFEGENPEAPDFKAICVAKRKGSGFEYDPADDINTMRKKGLFVNEFSVADAIRAGVWGGTGKTPEKKKYSPWYKHPKRMLKMRARAFTLRDGWPDILKGMHSFEEMVGETVNIQANDLGTYEADIQDTPPVKQETTLYTSQAKTAEEDPIVDATFDDDEKTEEKDGLDEKIEKAEQKLAAEGVTQGEKEALAAKEESKEFKADESPQERRHRTGAPAYNGPPEGVRMDGLPEWGEAHPLWPEKWHNMRAGNGKTTGFAVFLKQFAHTLKSVPEANHGDLAEKWRRLYDDIPYPYPLIDETENHQEEKDDNESVVGPSTRDLFFQALTERGLDIEKANECVTHHSTKTGSSPRDLMRTWLTNMDLFVEQLEGWSSPQEEEGIELTDDRITLVGKAVKYRAENLSRWDSIRKRRDIMSTFIREIETDTLINMIDEFEESY